METNNNVNKCIKKKKGDGNPFASITREITKSTRTQFAVETNTSSKAGKIFRWDNESLVPKIKWSSSHAVSSSRNDSSDSSSLVGNRTLISHFPFRLSFFYLYIFFCCSSRSDSSSWAVDLAEFLSNRGTTGEFKLLPSDAPQHQNVCAQSFIFCMFYGAIGTGDNIWIPVWPTGSWHVRVQDIKTFNL